MARLRNRVFREFSMKVCPDYEQLARYIDAHRALNRTIVATIGSWDMLHIGHLRYLIRAKGFGDILIVGVDSDRAVRKYKGPLRPIIPQAERMEMLSYQHCTDYVTLVDDIDDGGNWQYGLINRIQVNVFVAVEDSYPEEQRQEISKRCKKLIVLPRQASKTSSTNIIQNTIKGHLLTILNLSPKLLKRG